MDCSNNKVLRLPNVMEKTGLARSSLYLKVYKGLFPKPIKLGARAVGWLESDVDLWIEQCAQQNHV